MKTLAAKLSSSAVLAIALILCGLSLPARAAASTTALAGVSASSETSANRGPAKPEESDEEQFKHSASVQLVARITGLSLEKAYWLSVLLNFAVIAVVIIWVMKKNLPGVFRDRTTSIQKAMEEAREASEDANRRLGEIEARLSRFDAEIGQMRAVAEKEASEEDQRIKAAAEEDARKIVESAEHEIAAAAKSARRELTAYAADLAVTLARKRIHVEANTDQALVGDFARQLSGEARKGGQ
jgi:F-type H+-transporting ATPase subunit b